MTCRRVKHRLTNSGRTAAAIGVEQFENPALAGVVADQCDSFELRGASRGRRAVGVGGLAPLEHDSAKCYDPRAERGLEGRPSCFSLDAACLRQRLLGFGMVE